MRNRSAANHGTMRDEGAERIRTAGSSPSTDPRQDDAEHDGRYEITLTVSGLNDIGVDNIAHSMIEWAASEWGDYGPVVSWQRFRESRS